MDPLLAQEAVVTPDHHSVLNPAGSRFSSNGTLRIRLAAFTFLLFSVFCFFVAARITPSPSGYGTHRQLGYPACLMPVLTGYPCPTCGMTTAFAHAVRGQFISAFHAQPAGFAIALALLAGGLCSVRILATGNYDFIKLRIHPGHAALLVFFVLLFGWIYKMMTFHP